MINLKKIELELSTYCNAKCPLCARTQFIDNVDLEHISLKDIIRLFPTLESCEHKQFKFCGVLGDPLMNPEILEITKYIVKNNGYCNISTNSGIQTEQFWFELGRISAETKNVYVHFAVDGFEETNHIYRVNIDFNIINRNMQAYFEGGKGDMLGGWTYIVFDHNEHEVELAKKRATELNLDFVIRTGMRNSLSTCSTAKVSDKTEHTKAKKFKELQKKVETETVSKEIIDSVVCKYVHEDEIFISGHLKLFPCCFLWDSYFKNKENIRQKLAFDNLNWNNLKINSIDEVLQHKYYKTVLQESWNPSHNKHLKRCLLTCANNKLYHNQLFFK